jgi:hypothetical protein
MVSPQGGETAQNVKQTKRSGISDDTKGEARLASELGTHEFGSQSSANWPAALFQSLP